MALCEPKHVAVCYNNESVVFDDCFVLITLLIKRTGMKCGALRSQLRGMCEMIFVVITGNRAWTKTRHPVRCCREVPQECRGNHLSRTLRVSMYCGESPVACVSCQRRAFSCTAFIEWNCISVRVLFMLFLPVIVEPWTKWTFSQKRWRA
jgi:hypothetical protein